jgi:hypothetical protein
LAADGSVSLLASHHTATSEIQAATSKTLLEDAKPM